MAKNVTVKKAALGILGLLVLSLLPSFFPQQAYATTTTTTTFLSTTVDGYISSTAESYLSAWNNPTGTTVAGINFFIGGQLLSFTYYTIYRGFLFFDTSAISSGSILSATLSVYVLSNQSISDFDLTIQNGQPTYPHNPLQAEDYYRVFYSGYGGSRDTSTITGVGYWNITLTTTGLSFINTNGITKLALRSSKDIVGVAPTTFEYITIASRDYGEAYASKLTVTYEYGNIKYLIHGPYYEDGAVAAVLVNVTINQPYTSSYSFTLNGSSGSAETANISLFNVANFMIWNVTSAGNLTRIYTFLPTLTFDEVWVFVPRASKPWFFYQFSVTDFYGMSNPYLETTIMVSGATRIVERKSLSTVSTLTFSMVQWQRYGLRFRCDQGTYTQYFNAETSYSVNLEVLYGAFPTTTNDAPTASATRANTNITISYADPTLSTAWFYYEISHGSTTDTTLNLTTNSYNGSWNYASASVDYIVEIQAYANNRIYSWKFSVASPPPSVNPWDDLFESLGTFPTGFTPMYIPAMAIILCVLGIFSYFSAGVGCVLAWIVTGVFMVMGWYGLGIPTFAFAGFVSVLVVFAESKKTEREL